MAEVVGFMELFEAKWTELPDAADWTNLRFAREVLGRRKVRRADVIGRAPHGFPLEKGFQAARRSGKLNNSTFGSG